MSGYMDPPIVYTIGKVWSSFCGIFDDPYAGVAANRWNVWLRCVGFKRLNLASAEKLKLKYFGSQVSSTPA